ncbi:aminoacyl-tRNA hydrolase [bacterium]|nr:aminoacyl-tRNA hydrolase [bacterium]
MADDLVINARVTIPAGELEFTASRASGPGGQHVNTADTRVQLRWNVAASQALSEAQRQRLLAVLAPRLTEGGDLLLACATHRSQRRNRDEAAARLAELVRRALVPPRPRRPTRPTAASRLKRLEGKKRRGAVKRARGRPAGED